MATVDRSSFTVVDPKFINWIKCRLALNSTRKVIEQVVFDVIELFQKECQDGIHSDSLNEICDQMKYAIQAAHRNKSPSYNNTDATQLHNTDPWEVAKCYMPSGDYKDVKNAAETDFKGLISVIANHTKFENFFTNNNIFEEGIKVEEAVGDSSKVEIENADLQKYFSILNNILNIPGLEAKSKSSACEKLKQIQEKDYFVIGEDVFQNLLRGKSIQVESHGMPIYARVKQNERHTKKSSFGDFRVLIEDLLDSIMLLNESLTLKLGKIKEKAPSITGTGNTVVLTGEYHPPQTRGNEMLELQPDDGNLVILDTTQLDWILQNCNNTCMRGSFGTVRRTKEKVPGLDICVAIKQITTLGKDDKETLQFVTNEMIASRVKHFAIVPLIAYIDTEENEKRSFFFISPFFENGNLLDNIASDSEKYEKNRERDDDKKEKLYLNKDIRKKILYHIASAIDFLHTKVTGLRGVVLHVDLSSNNVVLDRFWNARLIDFGIACELKEKQTGKSVTARYGKDGYIHTKKDSKLRVYDDYHNFGVVIREVLTGKPPTEGPLRKEDSQDIINSFQLWKPEDEDAKRMFKLSINEDTQLSEDENTQLSEDEDALRLVNLSERCIESSREDKRNIESSYILKEMTELIKNQEQFTDDSGETGNHKKCTLCLVNKAVTGLNRVQHKCKKDINICVSCMRNSHINPIRCPHCSEEVYPKIGHTFAALLIAGNDTKRRSFADSMKREVRDIHDVLVSKWPCVVGIEEANVKVVAPSSPGNSELLIPQFKKAVEELKAKKGLETLIVYFTGHHNVERGFKLGNSDEYLSFDSFQDALSNICEMWSTPNSARVLVFLDCCKPKPIRDFTKENAKIIQINVCGSLQKCRQPDSGSIFKEFFIQALTRKSFNKKCINAQNEKEECHICSTYAFREDFVSVHSLHTYIAEHMNKYTTADMDYTDEYQKQQPTKYENGVKANDAIIAYNVDFAINPTIWFENERGEEPKKITICPGIYLDVKALTKKIYKDIKETVNEEKRRQMLSFIDEKLSDVVCIRIHNGQKDGKELNSMLELSSVMIGKREIVISFRKVDQILSGRAVVFQQCDFVLKLFNSENIPELKDECMETRVFRDTKGLDKFITQLNKQSGQKREEKSMIYVFQECFKQVVKIWRNDQESSSKQLKVGFPLDLPLIVFELAEFKAD